MGQGLSPLAFRKKGNSKRRKSVGWKKNQEDTVVFQRPREEVCQSRQSKQLCQILWKRLSKIGWELTIDLATWTQLKTQPEDLFYYWEDVTQQRRDSTGRASLFSQTLCHPVSDISPGSSYQRWSDSKIGGSQDQAEQEELFVFARSKVTYGKNSLHD